MGVLKSGLLCGAPKCTGTVCVCKGTELFAYVGFCLRRVLCDNEWNKGPKVTSRPITFSFKDIFYCLEGAWTDRTSFLVSPFFVLFFVYYSPSFQKGNVKNTPRRRKQTNTNTFLVFLQQLPLIFVVSPHLVTSLVITHTHAQRFWTSFFFCFV